MKGETLFDNEPDWKKEWKDMPEFNQTDKTAYTSVLVSFETKQDMELFSKLVDRNVTKKTKGFFFPVKSKKKEST